MVEENITKPISIDSLFEDFNKLKSDNLTEAIEVLAFENQYILGKEDTTQSLSKAIRLIEDSQPKTKYENALIGMLKEIKNYHLELKKEPETRDYSGIIQNLQKAESTFEKYATNKTIIFLSMACDYLGLATRNVGDNDKAIEYFQKARNNADKKWKGLYIDFNLGRLTGNIEMLKNAARTREEIMNEEKSRYEKSDNHLFLEYKWAVKNVLATIKEGNTDYQEFKDRWNTLENDYRNGHFLSEYTHIK